jgi:hypothetical protein
MCGEQGSTNKDKEDYVIAPGGPRPKDSVHPVGPGETVLRNPDGTYSVVPKEPAKNDEKEAENG